MSTRQYNPFATGGGANTLPYSTWSLLTTLIANGFQPGLADAQQMNTLLRQLSVATAGLAKFATDVGSVDTLDDGNVTNFANAILAAIDARIAAAAYSIPAPFAFTPTVYLGATPCSAAAQGGTALILGKLVFFRAFVQLSAKAGTGPATMVLSTMPSSIANAPCQLSVDLMNLTQHPSGMVATSTNRIELRAFDGTGSEAASLTDANFNNNSVVYAQGFYFKP